MVLGDGQTMANVLVRVKSGLPDGATWAPPSEPFLMNQEGCLYKPHVMSVMAGQTFRIGNADGIMHNVNAQPKIKHALQQRHAADSDAVGQGLWSG